MRARPFAADPAAGRAPGAAGVSLRANRTPALASGAVAPPIIAIPVKPFDIAKRRLASVVPPHIRGALSRALAEHTVEVVARTDAIPLVLSADDGVTAWAEGRGTDVLTDEGSSLDRAAHGAVTWAAERSSPWAILHADLPLLQPIDLELVIDHLAAGRHVLAPSSDGGTSLIGGHDRVRFAFGPASFHRHLARVAAVSPAVVHRSGLALDLDEPADLAAALAHPRGRWLEAVLSG